MSSPKDDLPDEYTPTLIRESKTAPRKQIVYACGYHDGKNSYGIFAGPFPNLIEALEVVPNPSDSRPAFLVRFNKNGTENFLYRWVLNRSLWKKVFKVTPSRRGGFV